jgi:hypothetical protein
VEQKRDEGTGFSSRGPVKAFLVEMWARLDSAELFSVFNEWRNRLDSVIESGGGH